MVNEQFLVLTHHHMDHTGGLRAYAAQGATLLVVRGSADHFRKVLAAPFTRNPSLAPKYLSGTPIFEVDGRQVLTDGTREVTLQVIDNAHASGMLVGYIAHANLGWVTDLWSPGRDPLPEKLNPNQAALVAGLKKAGLTPAKFAAAHGSTGEYATLAALEASNAPPGALEIPLAPPGFLSETGLEGEGRRWLRLPAAAACD